MPSAKKPEITTGNSLDVQPGVANIGENQATLEALRNANVDGQDILPQSVSAKRMSSEDIDVSGLVRSGTMLVGTGGVTVTSDANGGTPVTGLHIGTSTLQLIKSGVPQVTLDGTTGNATFIGAVTATSGTFTGTVQATAGYFVGSITIGTSTSVGGSAAGTWLTNERLLMKYGGVTKVDFNTALNTYYVAGELYATKFTVISNAANSVNFGADMTVGGNIIVDSTMGKKIFFDGSSGTNYIEGVSGGSFLHVRGGTALALDISATPTADPSITISSGGVTISVASGDDIVMQGATNTTMSSSYIGLTATTDMDLKIGTNSADLMALKRGTTTVMSFAGNANTVAFVGDITVSSMIASNNVYGVHKARDYSYKADTSFTFYAASTSGGSPTVLHTVTFKDGLVTSWSAA